MTQIFIRDTGIKITDILKLLSQGLGHRQIIEKFPTLSLQDILMSLQIANEYLEKSVKMINGNELTAEMKFVLKNGAVYSLDEIRADHPKAFAKWDSDEDARLVELFKSSKSFIEISEELKRTVGAVKARLIKHGLLT
jgi:uncharacterized protein (DUF433 family)